MSEKHVEFAQKVQLSVPKSTKRKADELNEAKENLQRLLLHLSDIHWWSEENRRAVSAAAELLLSFLEESQQQQSSVYPFGKVLSRQLLESEAVVLSSRLHDLGKVVLSRRFPELESVVLSSRLHDLGKVHIPDALFGQEFARILETQRHVQQHENLYKVCWIDPWRAALPGVVCREHHERFQRREETPSCTVTRNELHELRTGVRQALQLVDSLSEQVKELSVELQERLSTEDMGVDDEAARRHRYFPVRVYAADDDPEGAHAILDALGELLNASGTDLLEGLPPQISSWWQRLTGKTRDKTTKNELKSRLAKVERALEIATLDKPQAEVDLKLAEAAAKLIKAVETQSAAAVQVGSLLIVKVPSPDGESQLAVKTLTQREMMMIERTPELMKTPDELLAALNTPADRMVRYQEPALLSDHGPQTNPPNPSA